MKKKLYKLSVIFLISFFVLAVLFVVYIVSKPSNTSLKIREARIANDIEAMTFWNDSVGVRRWIAEGGNPNDIGLLHIATGPKGGLSVLKVLVQSGVDINEIRYDRTPLMNASSWCYYEKVKYLLEQGADVNLTNSQGKKAYDLTCRGLYADKVRDLLKNFENIDK